MSAQPFVLRWRRSLLATDELSPNERLVALVLMDHMDGDGAAARPELRRLASEAGLTKSTTHAALSSLVDAHWLDRRPRGRSRPVEYRARLPERASPPAPFTGAAAACGNSLDTLGHFRTEVEEHHLDQGLEVQDLLLPDALTARLDAARADVRRRVDASLEAAG